MQHPIRPCIQTAPHSTRYQRGQQKGVVLIVSLVLLLVLTLLGLAASRSSLMQGSMSANLTDRDRALQAAEFAANKAASQIQTWINSNNSILNYDTAGKYMGSGVYDVDPAAADQPWVEGTATWDSADSVDAGAVTQGSATMALTTNPRYMIGVYPANTNGAPIYGSTEGTLSSTSRRFTITAIGYGAQPNTQIKIQVEFYSKI